MAGTAGSDEDERWVVGRVPELGLDRLTERVPADERESALAWALASASADTKTSRFQSSVFANFTPE